MTQLLDSYREDSAYISLYCPQEPCPSATVTSTSSNTQSALTSAAPALSGAAKPYDPICLDVFPEPEGTSKREKKELERIRKEV